MAAVVYAGIALIRVGRHGVGGPGGTVLGALLFLLTFAGPLLVQGALVEIVRDVHEGQPVKSAGALFRRGRQRLLPLVGASIVYSFGILGGLLLLVVPGVLVIARWSLLAPLVVLENSGVGAARRRSSELVRGSTAPVFWTLAASYILTGWPYFVLAFVHVAFTTNVLATFAVDALTAPFSAHVLTVIYYRLADPDRPVIHPSIRSGAVSVWEG